MAEPHLRFYFDPVCPFAWLTSQWVRRVAALRAYRVEWRFISLRLVNADIDYAAHFPPDYEAGHTAGLRLLRVAARARDEYGPGAVGPLYQALGALVFESERDDGGPARLATREFVGPTLTEAGLPADLAEALDDTSWDAEIQAETDEALTRTGKDVGTPIVHFAPPDGPAFFGPVISRLPDDEQSLELWDHVVALARFPGFAELKRSLRERPQVASEGVRPGDVGVVEDWHAGSRRLKR